MGITAAVIGEVALDAGTVAAADATAAGLGFSSAAEAISAGAVDAATLGLPEATTIADLGAVDGTASAGFVSSGADAGIAGGVAADTGAGAASGGGVIPAEGGDIAASQTLPPPSDVTTPTFTNTPSAQELASLQTGGPQDSTLSGILGKAGNAGSILTGLNALSQLGGGAARVAGGVQAQQAGKQAQALIPQAAPFQPYQSQLSAQLFNLLSNPNTVTTTPGYQFNLQQGLQAQAARQAAQGNLVSGGALLQANQFGQQYAQSSLNQQESMLASLTGATQSPAAAAGVQGGLLAGSLGGSLGGTQAVAGGLGNIISPLSTLYSLYNQPSPDKQVA